jgi:hypothetical protein
MTIDKTSSAAGGPPLDSGPDKGAAPDVERKETPSAFDKVMETKERDGGHREDARKAGARDPRAKDAAPVDKEAPLREFPVYHHLRARTLERTASPDLKVERSLPRQVIDEVVQAVRVGVNRAGDKELQFDLKSNVLDGMTIRVSIHEGKVVTILEAASRDVKDKLESHVGELMHTLTQKGLQVANVEVQYKEPPKQQGQQQGQQQQQQQEQEDADDWTEI